jgi:secondary thiamine-phosphate synthase enzyme
MAVETRIIKIQSKKENDMINLTGKISGIISGLKVSDGIVNIFVKGSTGSIITIEYEPGLIGDFPDMLSRIIPKDIKYGHEEMWHDGNGHSHVKASLVGPSLTVPFNNNTLYLGTWQQIVFVEFDTRNRNREIILQIIGE